MLYKMDLLCIDAKVYSVVNIRLDMDKHALSKSQRKVKRKGVKRGKSAKKVAAKRPLPPLKNNNNF